VIKGTKYDLMRKEYGDNFAHQCLNCCNLQKHPYIRAAYHCVAFGLSDNYNCIWEPSELACGIFNKPFLALTPKRRPLVEVYGPQKREVVDDHDDQQLSVF
jgi:hypothetical protein